MFTPPNMSRVTCHLSRVKCHVSHVTCHMLHVTCHIFFFFYKVVKLIGGGSVINGAYPVQFSFLVIYHQSPQSVRHFEILFTTPCEQQVICHVSHVTCHVSCVTYQMSHVTWTKCWSLSMEGLLSKWPTTSNFLVE